MITENQIISFCEKFLETEKFSDYCKNGLQISGKNGGNKNNHEVQKIALGVTASKNFLKKSAEWGADLCICHHGIIFGKVQEINDILRGRLEILIQNNMGLAGFHLPLDAHTEIGNNAIICKKLGLRDLEKVSVGFTGNIQKSENSEKKISGVNFQKFLKKVELVMGQKANFSGNFYEKATGKNVSRVCVISGGSSKFSAEALESGADTFVFGEISESAVHELRERNLNFIVAGHYATEVFGVQALGEKILENFSPKKTENSKKKLKVSFFQEDILV